MPTRIKELKKKKEAKQCKMLIRMWQNRNSADSSVKNTLKTLLHCLIGLIIVEFYDSIPNSNL